MVNPPDLFLLLSSDAKEPVGAKFRSSPSSSAKAGAADILWMDEIHHQKDC